LPAEPHHLRFAQRRALGRTFGDEFTVPLCRLHHRELQRHGDEAAWRSERNIDPLPINLPMAAMTSELSAETDKKGRLEALMLPSFGSF
jgi:hypothetical protein